MLSQRSLRANLICFCFILSVLVKSKSIFVLDSVAHGGV